MDNYLIDGNENKLYDGDRVYTYELDGKRIYGTLMPNNEHPEVSEWCVQYDDGENCAVLDPKQLFKA